MHKIIVALLVLCLLCETAQPASRRLRNGVFLHHSTGAAIWGPNGGTVSVPGEVAKYNQAHNLTGDAQVTLDNLGWPLVPWQNEWERWHRIFLNTDTLADIRPILRDYRIVMIKSCFPSSDMVRGEGPSDTLNPTANTPYNYKWHWRAFVRVMASHRDNFFIIWTNAPLVAKLNNPTRSRLARDFCRWAKDTLARGLDPLFGAFPPNVYVFDFFRMLTDSSGVMLEQYQSDTLDPHPNAAATALVAPQLVKETFDAALSYESLASVESAGQAGRWMEPLQNYPNPFNPSTTITYRLAWPARVSLMVFDLLGRQVVQLVEESQNAGSHQATFDARTSGRELPSGIYILRLVAQNPSGKDDPAIILTHRLVLIR